MRTWPILPLVLLTTGCLAPGTRDPTRYPWDVRAAAAQPRIEAVGAVPRIAEPLQQQPTGPTFCVIAIQPSASTGITFTGNAPPPTCPISPSARPR